MAAQICQLLVQRHETGLIVGRLGGAAGEDYPALPAHCHLRYQQHMHSEGAWQGSRSLAGIAKLPALME